VPARTPWPAAVAVLVGCGHSRPEQAPDALRVGDAPAIDGSSADARAFAPIRVTVYDENNPGYVAVGVRVVFTAPDLSSQTVVTDAAGIAEASSPPGSTVTVVQQVPAFAGTAFSTIMALQPGDAVFAGPRLPRREAAGGTFEIDFPTVPNGRYYTAAIPCPFQGGLVDDVPERVTTTFFTPCMPESGATLVGRVKDANNMLLGVSILEDVDLAASAGTTIMMPAFTASPIPITAEITNVAPTVYTVDWHTYYELGDKYAMHLGNDFLTVLDSADAWSSATGDVDLATSIYPVGGETTFELDLFHDGLPGRSSEYHDLQASRATDFAFDASSMIRSVVEGTAHTDEVTWTESASGRSPTLVTLSLRWGSVQGVITAPYTGQSVSLAALPADLRPTSAPDLFDLQLYDRPGSNYYDLLGQLNEVTDVRMNWMLPVNKYWRTCYPCGHF
jgi:hypothetical protein